MVNKNKNLFIVSAIIIISPLLAYAWENNVNYSNNNVSLENNEYEKHYSIFKEDFYKELLNKDFSNIDAKIKWYLNDIEYLKSNPDSSHYNNISIYEIKVKVLEDLKNNFSNQINSVKKEYNKVVEKTKEIAPIVKEQIKKDFSNTKKIVKNVFENLKDKYKTYYNDKLKDKLENISEEKLEIILWNISKKIEEIISSNKFTQKTKEKILAQLEALKEIIQEKIWEKNEEINLEELWF